MIKLALGIGSVIIAILVNGWYRPPVEHIHYHAGFRVYIHGVKQDYSDSRYMNYTPCSEHEEKISREEEQIERAHLHEQVGDVVHSHRQGATWGDLFTNIMGKFEGEVHGYVDGVRVENIMQKEIHPYSTAIVIVGEDNPVLGKEQISRAYIVEIESESELCGS